MIGALRKYGLLKGLWKGTGRLLRCHPWHPGGLDPVRARPGSLSPPYGRVIHDDDRGALALRGARMGSGSVQVLPQVVRIFQADGEPHQAGG
jgi:hypothetical protein